MAFVPTILKPVHVRAYWRFRLFRWEFVHEHWRSLPNRQEEINLSPESGSNLSDKDFLFLLNSRYLTVFLLKLILKCKRIVRPSISLITYSQSCYPWFIIVFRSGPIQIASMHLPHKARLGVNTISSKNLEGFCSQAQIWFTARNAPVKTSKVFVHYFFLSPVCEIYTMPPVEYYVVNRKTGMVGFGPTTY